MPFGFTPRCPTARPFGRPLQYRLEDPGPDIYCMTNIGRGLRDKTWTGTDGERREAGILTLAREGVVLQPAESRMEELSKTNTFISDWLAGDTRYLFCSVNWPPPMFGGHQLVYEPDMFQQLEGFGVGRIAYRPFDLKVDVYEEVGVPYLSRYGNMGYSRWGIEEPFEPYARLVKEHQNFDTRDKIRPENMELLHEISQGKDWYALQELREYMRKLADCFTVYGFKNAVTFSQIMGQLRQHEILPQEALDRMAREDFFRGARERAAVFHDTYDHMAFLPIWQNLLVEKMEFLGDASWSSHDSWGEWLWAGDLPICCAEGTAEFDMPGGNWMGYKYVEGSFEPFPAGTCAMGWRG